MSLRINELARSAERTANSICLVFIVIGFVPGLVAQQYCVSGAITSIQNCNGCKFNIGDPVAMTVSVVPSSITCNGIPGTMECTADTSATMNIGSRSWASRGNSGGLVFASQTFTPGKTVTSLVMPGVGYLSPGPATDPDDEAGLTFSFSFFPGDLIPGGTLPSTLPSPSTLSGSNTAVSFNAFILPSGSIPVSQVDTARPNFSYTGQNCAAAPPQPPVVNNGGIVPVFSAVNTIQPGSWVSIFGTGLAAAATTWNGDFPTSLGNTTVTINNKPAYLWYVSPTQINLQAPDDTARGPVNVVVATAGGSITSTVTLAQFGPSFSLLDAKHVAAIIIRSDGSGAYGGGTYDIAGPTGTSLGYKTVAAKAGDVLEIFGVGFGPTSPAVPAGQAYSGAAATTNSVRLSINNVTVTPSFAGLTSAGLYQINVALPPGLGAGDVALQATAGGSQTPSGVVLSVQ